MNQKRLQEIDAAIFNRAAKIVRGGNQHQPVILFYAEDPGKKPGLIDVGQAINDEHGKLAISHVIQMLAERPEVAVVVFVSEAWMVVPDGPEDQAAVMSGAVRPSQHPSRAECVVVAYSISGGSRATSVHKIVRTPGRKPRLERGGMTLEGEQTFEGRFFADPPVKH